MRYQIINSPASTGLSGSRPLTSSRLNATPTPSTLLHAADAAEEEGRIEDAIGCLLEALKMCTASGISHRRQSSEINERLGVMHLGKDMIEESIGFFTEGIRVDPTYSKNYLHRAECFVLTDDPHSAFTEYEKYFKLEHATKAQLVRCGKCALDADLLDEAEAYLMATLAHPDRDSPDSNTNSAYACYNLGEVYEKRGKDQEASKYFAEVSAHDPNFYEPYHAQAEDEFSKNNFPMALHLFGAVAKIQPWNEACFTRLADVYEQLGEEFSASVLSCLSKALELKQTNKNREDSLVRRGALLFRSFAQVTEAISDFSHCLALNSDNPNALENRAVAYRARGAPGDSEAAVADYKRLVSLPNVVFSVKSEPYRFIAVDCFRAEDYATAARFFAYAELGGASLSRLDTLMARQAMAWSVVNGGDNFEESYESRGWPQREQEKGKKVDPNASKGFPVPSLGYQLVDRFYLSLREREPTMHSDLEYCLITLWKPFRDEVERKREDAEALRLGKKPKKGK
jgi:tetratricopeptide (TPR) repeat protein